MGVCLLNFSFFASKGYDKKGIVIIVLKLIADKKCFLSVQTLGK